MSAQGARAPAVAQKLEIALSDRASLDQEIGQAALDAAEGVRGADKRLADLRIRIAAADRDVEELAKAHTLAQQLDARALVAARAKTRSSQMESFTELGRERDTCVAEICDAIAKLSRTYGRYVNVTAQLMATLPTGTYPPPMNLGCNGTLGSWNGDLQALIAAEAFRHIDVNAPIRAKLPFAAAPSLSLSDNPRAVENCAQVFQEATAAVLNEIQGQIAKLDARDAEALGTKEAA
jgi:hypothetical protein